MISVLIVVLVLGYFGFVPGVSDLMGANSPRDIGVKPTATALSSVNSKLGVAYSTLPATAVGAASLSESGSRQISVQLTSEEVTALINDHASRWKYYPIEDVQVKINADNTIELSGVLRVDRWSGYADAIGLPEGTRSQIRPYLSYVQTNPAIYMKGTLTIQGYAQMGMSALQIGRVTIPADQANSYAGVLEYFAQDVSHLYQVQISQMYASGGKLVVTGSIPTNVALSPPTEQQAAIRQTSFWAPSPEKAVEAFGLVTLIYVVGNLLRAQLSAIAEKLGGMLPSGIQMWIENYISSKHDIALEAGKGSAFKLTKVELIAYGIALTTLTIAFTYSSAATLAEMLVAIPVVLATSILIEFLKNYLLTIFARSKGAWTEYRIWPPGFLMFVVSAFVFKTPFSSPSKSAQSEGEAGDRIGGLMAVSGVLLVLLFAGGFYYMSVKGISEIGNIGLGMCLLSAFFDSIPVPPLNGKDIWDWNKRASIVLLVATFALNLYWLMFM
ncbi:MAG: hypothetical protein NTV61_02945 [Candidatus Bathyarchaeota archaeon]|nr:hypothetical protein [Candidatus Bathyarchaeota archaeon]